MDTRNTAPVGALAVFLVLALAPSVVRGQTQAPSWYMDKERDYPSSFFIAAVGEGTSREEAETAALATVSQFFNVKTEVRNEAIREFNEAVRGSATDFTKKTYINENAVVRSDAEFLAVHYGTPWFDGKRNRWAAIAYIDRTEAGRIYEGKIAAVVTALDALSADAAAEREPLYACALLNRAIQLSALAETLVETAAVVDPFAAGRYTAALEKISAARAAHRALRDGLTFTIVAAGVTFNGRLEAAVAELLENQGYTVTAGKGRYTLRVTVTAAEETNSAGIFVRSSIAVRMENSGLTFFSYTKNYDRSGHKTLDGAYNRAFVNLEADLAGNFTEKLTAFLGR